MNSGFRRAPLFAYSKPWISAIIALSLFAAPLMAQRPTATPAKTQAQREATPRIPDPTFETLLGADTYKVYGEVRNVGQLLITGGLAEGIEPIIKSLGPPQEFQSIVRFLKNNSEALATSRLMFASWPVRADVPNAFVAIEFATPEEAARFSPKLETFLPTVLQPAPASTEPKVTAPAQVKSNEAGKEGTPASSAVQANGPKLPPGKTDTETKKETAGGQGANPPPRSEPLPFVIDHKGNLVFITDKPFRFEKLHPASARSLAEDQNFRIAHERFSAEPIFLYLNLALEEKPQPKAPPPPKISEEEKARIRAEEEARRQKEIEAEVEAGKTAEAEMTRVDLGEVEIKEGKPTPKETMQNAQREAFSQIGRMFETLGSGEPQWPEAVGAALTLDNDEYVLRAILIEPAERRKVPLPFVPQVLSGPAFAADVPSVLPGDTEVFVSASIDLAQTYEGMRKEAERKAKANVGRPTWQRYEKGVLVGQGPPAEERPDAFAEFEKKAGFKIKDDLLPALGNEIAVAASLKAAEGLGLFGSPKPSPSPDDSTTNQARKGSDVFPMLLIAVKDRDAARRLMPRVLDGLGIGEANMIAQVERHDDAEIVNYAGMFAYAFVGNFLVISEAATVRHVVDAWSNRQTLSGNSVFRNFTRWQPRQGLGQIYVSPALMDGYRELLNKQAPKMDAALRDLLMRLNPAPQAISYSLSNEGLGALHELHLPKDLVIAMFAGTAAAMSAIKEGSPETNEMIAISGLRMIAAAEATYQSTEGNGSFGSLDKLVEKNLVSKEMLSKYGYRFDVTASGDQFEAIATPLEYGKTGTRSFFVDKSGVVRGDDHGGGLATVSDKPVQ